MPPDHAAEHGFFDRSFENKKKAVAYQKQVKAKFPEGWYDRLAKAFDKYLDAYDAEQLNEGNTLFDLYKVWRDQCKVGFNRVDLEKLLGWLKEHGNQS